MTAAKLAAEHGVSLTRLATIAPHDDVHEALLTVRETLTFTYALGSPRPPASAPAAVLDAWSRRVDDVIASLGLSECADTIIGSSELRGISGGQRKRVTLALALLSNARILALDEAANGLDAPRALSVLSLVRESVRASGSTAIISLEAPTPEVLELADAVVILAEGRELYHGPPAFLRLYLHALGFALPRHMDLADFAIQWATSPEAAAALHKRAGSATLTEAQTRARQSLAAPPPVASTDVRVLTELWRRCRAGRALATYVESVLPSPAHGVTIGEDDILPAGALAQIDTLSPELLFEYHSSHHVAADPAAGTQGADQWRQYRVPPPSLRSWLLLLWREVTLLRRNAFLLVSKVVQALLWCAEKGMLLIRRTLPSCIPASLWLERAQWLHPRGHHVETYTGTVLPPCRRHLFCNRVHRLR